MGKVNRDGLMGRCMKESGSREERTDLANFITQMAIYMRASGSTTKRVARGPTLMLMERSTLVIGRTTSSMAMEWSPGLIVRCTMGCMRKEINTAKAR